MQPAEIADPPPGAGGYDFLADPNRRVGETAIFWHPDELASVVILTIAPSSPASTETELSRITLADLPGGAVRREAKDGAHMIIRDGLISYQLWIIGQQSRQMSLAALIPLDPTAPRRTDATLQFLRFMAEGRPRPPPAKLSRIKRLVTILRALDGRLSGASYRTIAEALFGSSRVATEPWKTAPLRDTVIRLTRTGFAMMRGEYRKLLGPGRRN